MFNPRTAIIGLWRNSFLFFPHIMFNPRTAITGLHEIHLSCLPTTTTITCFAITALALYDHDIFTPPVMCARHLLVHHADVGCQLDPPSPQLFPKHDWCPTPFSLTWTRQVSWHHFHELLPFQSFILTHHHSTLQAWRSMPTWRAWSANMIIASHRHKSLYVYLYPMRIINTDISMQPGSVAVRKCSSM